MKILLATDGSTYSDEAAKFLTHFEFSPKDTIALFHVVSEVPYADEYSKQILQAIKRVSPKILKSCEDALGTVNAHIIKEELQGVPEDEIVRKADELNADLIVMGARGVKGLTSLFLGSVTRTVSALTSRSLLVIKPFRKEPHAGFKILFCTDGSPSAHATAELLSKLPFPADTEIVILTTTRSAFADIPDRYAMEVNDAVRDDLMRIRAAEAEDASAIVDRSQRLLSGKFSAIHPFIKGGDPAQVILAHAEEMQADLIALGSRGLKGIKGMLGSVSRRVLGRAQCPVLIGKQEQ